MRRRDAVIAVVLVLLGAVVAGCSGTTSSTTNGVLKVGMPNGPLTNNNNPFIGSSSAMSLGYGQLIYEPLVMTNPIAPTKRGKPWLATKWSWSDNYTRLALTVRDNVVFSDGKPMTAKDAAYTFRLLKEHPGLNYEAIPFASITVKGNRVSLTFDSSQFVNRNKILSTVVVPEHQWSTFSDPATATVPHPIGTGPYSITSFTSQTVTLRARDHYWRKKPAVREVRYTSYNDNRTQTTALANDRCDWSYVVIPDPQKLYISKDPDNHKMWFPPVLAVHGLVLNAQRAPLNDVVLRKAMNMAVNRHEIVTQGEGGPFYPEVDNASGLPLPIGARFLSPRYRGNRVTVDVAGAKKLLTDAGYRYSGNTLLDKSGKPVTLTLSGPAGWADYQSDLKIIKDNLATIGITATVGRVNQNAWNQTVDTGNFQATLHWTNTGSTPYDLYRTVMDGALYKPIGTGGTGGNWGRFDDDSATNALRRYAVATSESARATALNTLENVMANQVPMIPLFAVNDGGEYSTEHWIGWPNAQHPYAGLQPNKLGALQVVLHLRTAS